MTTPQPYSPMLATRTRRQTLAGLHGQRLTDVELLEWTGPDLAHGMVAVSLGPSDLHYARHMMIDPQTR
jgi:hypothetical protein